MLNDQLRGAGQSAQDPCKSMAFFSLGTSWHMTKRRYDETTFFGFERWVFER